MSTSYQLLFTNKNQIADPECEFRFYKKRNIAKTQQSQWMYQIFKESMNARIKAIGILVGTFKEVNPHGRGIFTVP